MQEPKVKRCFAFFDGQNLFHAAKEAFGYSHPNYDPKKLAEAVCKQQGWTLAGALFYTGIPDSSDNAFWNAFWQRKLAVMGTRGVKVYSRHLRYRNQTVKVPNGPEVTVLVAQEKGIDIRIALDVVHHARENSFDVALIFSQDQDLPEVADEVRSISKAQDRWMKIASAFPFNPAMKNRRGINKTDWCKIERAMYDASLDPVNYRAK